MLNLNKSPRCSSHERLDSSCEGKPTGGLRTGVCRGKGPTAEAKTLRESPRTTYSEFVAVKMLSAAKSSAQGIKAGGRTELVFKHLPWIAGVLCLVLSVNSRRVGCRLLLWLPLVGFLPTMHEARVWSLALQKKGLGSIDLKSQHSRLR